MFMVVFGQYLSSLLHITILNQVKLKNFVQESRFLASGSGQIYFPRFVGAPIVEIVELRSARFNVTIFPSHSWILSVTPWFSFDASGISAIILRLLHVVKQDFGAFGRKIRICRPNIEPLKWVN